MTKKKKKNGETACLVEGCNSPVFPGYDFCPVHGLVDIAVEGAQDAFEGGDFWKALFNSGAAVLLHAGGPMVKPALQGAAMNFAQRQAQAQQQRQAPPPRPQAPKVDPWMVLGLDRTKATKKDVKDAQKHFAAFYHPDTGRAVNPEVLKQVNAAAEACLKDLG